MSGPSGGIFFFTRGRAAPAQCIIAECRRGTGMMGMIGALWGVSGVLLLLGSAVYRLGPLAVDAFSYDFLWYHWTCLLCVVFFMAYAEGYVGFQQRFSPRVAARARYHRRRRCRGAGMGHHLSLPVRNSDVRRRGVFLFP